MNTCRLFVMLMVIVMYTGCSHVTSYIDIVKDKGLSKEYLDTLDTWTRSQTVYSEFETRVTIKATYKGTAFNQAYFKEYTRIYQLPDEERKMREDAQINLSSDFTEFLFYAYTPEKESNDFSKARSIWTVFLLDEKGKRINPVEIRKIDKITPVITVFYPYVNQYYGTFYSIKFPPAADSGVKTGDAKSKIMKLIFTSVLGKVELEWKL